MKKCKLTMLVVMGMCALGASTVATSFEGANRGTGASEAHVRKESARPGTEAPRRAADASRRATEKPRQGEARENDASRPRLSMRADKAGSGIAGGVGNSFGEAFERMQRNMDMMEAYYDKHFKRFREPFEGALAASEEGGAEFRKKRNFLAKSERDESRIMKFSVSRRVSMMDDLPVTAKMPDPGARVKLASIADGHADAAPPVEHKNGAVPERRERGPQESIILDQLEKIDPVSLEDFEVWGAKENPAELDRLRDENVELNEKSRELDARNKVEEVKPDPDKDDKDREDDTAKRVEEKPDEGGWYPNDGQLRPDIEDRTKPPLFPLFPGIDGPGGFEVPLPPLFIRPEEGPKTPVAPLPEAPPIVDPAPIVPPVAHRK